MSGRDYKELIVWQKAVDLVTEVYRQTECFPQREVFGLTNQMRRAAVSIPCNIAEGQGRNTVKEFLNFLAIARASLQELETQVIISQRLGYLTEPAATALLTFRLEVARILSGLIASLSASAGAG